MQRIITYSAVLTILTILLVQCDTSSIVQENNLKETTKNLTKQSATSTSSGSGTVTPENPKITYTDGPFLVANITGTTGDLQCGTATPCSNYSLTVETPAGYGSDHIMEIKIKWSTSEADFDLYVLDSSGSVVASAASTSDPEIVKIPPTSGDYTIRVVPYAPLGETFTGTIQLKDKASPPPPSGEEPPTYHNYVAPESLPNAHNAGEPSIGVNWNTGSAMYQAYYSTYRVKFNDDVSPAAVSWKDVTAGLPDCTAEESLDPILWTDHKTGRTYESQLIVNPALNSLTCFSDDDGDNWTVSEGGGIGSGVDHQTLGGGPFADTGIGPVTNYPDIVYYCSQDDAAALCSVSRDGGVTFSPAVPIYTLEECGGLHGHVKVGPKGTAYVPNGSCGNSQAVIVSTDNGSNWAIRKNPDSSPDIGSDPAVQVGANGTTYFGYQNADGHAHAAISLDHGQTWKYDQDIGAQIGIKNIVFPAVIAGDDNRAAVAFLGTKTAGNYQSSDFSGVWHLYIATTYDGGKTWVTSDATPNDPVQRGPICTGGTTCSGHRNLLDFIGIDVDHEGRVLVAYADGCTGDCVSGGPNNNDALATIARQTSGKRLFAKYDPKPDLTPESISYSQSTNKKETTLTATIANKGKADANDVLISFLDGSTEIGQTTLDLTAGNSGQVSITWDTQKEGGDHTITVVADPNNVIQESNERNNKHQKTITLR